jgi:asparagine synthase (glutamine-hydrolysing)
MRRGDLTLIANAEIYNFRDIQAKYGFEFETDCDIEIILHLYEKYGSVDKFIDELDGVFAFMIHDGATGETSVARDPIGVRPVHMGKDNEGNYAFASEAKTLKEICVPTTISQFKPGHYWTSKNELFTKWYNPTWNFEKTNLDTFDEQAAFKTTAELLY